jgi:hypothetical protein
MIRQYIQQRKNETDHHGNLPKNATVNRELAILREAYSLAMKDERLRHALHSRVYSLMNPTTFVGASLRTANTKHWPPRQRITACGCVPCLRSTTAMVGG